MSPAVAMDYGSPRTRPGGSETGRTVVTIHIPARPEYIAVLRGACGQLAPRLGCSPAETADLQLVVDEACGFLLRNCLTAGDPDHDGGLAAAFVVEGPSLHITLEMQADVFISPDDDEFADAILTALVDHFAWHVEDSAVRVEIRKQRADGRHE
ncbi:hypothetical protein ABIA35_004517 [Catenulispora sp. MAP12-49]|uniref:ATP-binding protein n=1 Tax=Catenulispora sp. MAP12-49 TaxID=3156302 RepID=UPI003517AFD2